MKHARWTNALIPLLAIGAISPTLGLAQPERETTPARAAERDGAPPHDRAERALPRGRLELELQLDPEALRIRLERMVQRGQDMTQRAQAALDQLDAGAAASDVLSELRPQDGQPDPESGRPERASPKRPDNARENTPSPKRGTPSKVSNEEIHDFLKAEFPELWANLKPILEQDPRNADRLLGRMAPQIREILALRRSQPELASTKTEQMRAGLDFVESARIYRTLLGGDASESEINEAVETMRAFAEQRFDAELRAKRLELAQLEEHLSQLRFSVEALEGRRELEVQRVVSSAQENAERLSKQQRQRRERKGTESGSGDD